MSLSLPSAAGAPRLARRRAAAVALTGDRAVLAALGVALVAMLALTWRKWGVPELDAGAELTTAESISRGALPYADVRYFYGPLGLYVLAGSFKLLGVSLGVAFAVGMVQTAAILGTFYALARRWLEPVVAGLASAIVLAIAFTGTERDFVLPHTNSATFGLLCLLGQLLAFSRGRALAGGLMTGLVMLTRPEFAAIAAAVACAYVVGAWRDAGRRAALAALARIAVPGVALPAAVLGAFAAAVGAHRLFLENLWPVAFIHQAGFRTQSFWMPFTLSSAVGTGVRALAYGGLLAGLVATVPGWRRAAGVRRIVALWPLLAAAAAIALVVGAWRASGAFAAEQREVQAELTKLLIVMSWLPALGFAAGAWGLLRLLRGRSAPLSSAWAADLPLLVAAGALGPRAYDAFTPERSYAPYYAAPLVLLLAILHARIARRHPAARAPVLAALGAVALALAAYSYVGLYADESATIHTPRGSYLTDGAAGPGLRAVVARIDAASRPGERILAAPVDAGLYFLTGRRPALYELTLLPGLLGTAADERRAIARLAAERVRLAVVASRDFSVYGPRSFGTDYDRLLGAYLRRTTASRSVAGHIDPPVAGAFPARGYTIMQLEGKG